MLRRAAAIALVSALAAVVLPPAYADPVRDRQRPVLAALEAEEAWKTSKGRGVTVAVLDSGVDAGQRDLRGAVTAGPDFTKGANPDGVKPKRDHGTAMASLIAGRGHGSGSGSGVIGVAPEARLLSARVILENEEPGYVFFNANERFSDSMAKGIRWAVDKGAHVINLSLGRPVPTKDERIAIGYAVSRGVVVVAAAGNQGSKKRKREPYSYPASYPGVLSVAAANARHRHAGFSNRNAAVVLSAPGVRIPAAGPGNNYFLVSGTSPASALVSGVAALIRARYPKMAPALVTQALIASAGHRPPGGYSPATGFGNVSAAAALAEAAKLARARGTAGLKPTERFGGDAPPPVQIVRRDSGTLAIYGALGSAGLLCFLVCVVFFLRARRRTAPLLPLLRSDVRTAKSWQPATRCRPAKRNAPAS